MSIIYQTTRPYSLIITNYNYCREDTSNVKWTWKFISSRLVVSECLGQFLMHNYREKFWKYVGFHSKLGDTFILLPSSCNEVSNILLPATVSGLVLWKFDLECLVT